MSPSLSLTDGGGLKEPTGEWSMKKTLNTQPTTCSSEARQRQRAMSWGAQRGNETTYRGRSSGTVPVSWFGTFTIHSPSFLPTSRTHTHTHTHASGQLQVYSTLRGKTTRYCMTLSTSVTVSSRTLSCWGLVSGGVNPVVKSRGTSLCWEKGKSCSKRTLQLSTVCACVIFAWVTVCIFNRGVGCNNSKWATGAPSGRRVQRGGWEEPSTIRGGVGRVADQLDRQLFCFWSITIVEIV